MKQPTPAPERTRSTHTPEPNETPRPQLLARSTEPLLMAVGLSAIYTALTERKAS